MARVPIRVAAADPATGNALGGVAVTVRNRATGAAVTLYAGETGGTTVANPLTTDAYGRAQAWADRAPFRLDYAGSGLTAFTEYRDVGPSSDRGIDSLLLPHGALPAFVTALPSNPVDGQECYYNTPAGAGSFALWHLRYNAGHTDAYKWDFLGGAGLYAYVYDPGSVTTSATAYAATPFAGSLTIPLAGYYDVHGEASGQVLGAANGDFRYGIVAGTTALAWGFGSSYAASAFHHFAPRGRSLIAAGQVIRAAHASATASLTVRFWETGIGATPVRVG